MLYSLGMATYNRHILRIRLERIALHISAHHLLWLLALWILQKEVDRRRVADRGPDAGGVDAVLAETDDRAGKEGTESVSGGRSSEAVGAERWHGHC